MGLAASQARFLGITARKSNIEYEGQQVNQQRTALAQEVNSLYSRLLALDVPVAPDTTDYYETNYSFSISNSDGFDGNYVIKSYYQNDDGTYYLNTERTYNKNVAEGKKYSASAIKKDESSGTTTYTLETSEGSFTLTADAANSQAMAKLINETYGEGTVKDDEKFYYYTDKDGLTHYISKTEVEGAETLTNISSYASKNKQVTDVVAFPSATVQFDTNGRMSSINGAVNPSTGEEISFNSDVDTTRIHNDEGYEAALRDYTMSKDEYDKMVADLNAKTESLQQEDKVLELRLNQIDTEQNELKTELEAVKKVLDDNIENTFKTFA